MNSYENTASGIIYRKRVKIQSYLEVDDMLIDGLAFFLNQLKDSSY